MYNSITAAFPSPSKFVPLPTELQHNLCNYKKLNSFDQQFSFHPWLIDFLTVFLLLLCWGYENRIELQDPVVDRSYFLQLSLGKIYFYM